MANTHLIDSLIMRMSSENWECLYGKLDPGVYRIGKSMIDDLRMGDARFNKFRITKQFQIFE